MSSEAVALSVDGGGTIVVRMKHHYLPSRVILRRAAPSLQLLDLASRQTELDKLNLVLFLDE